MANYLKATDFGAKDALLSGDPNKIVKGTEINDEFNALQTAVNSKANTNNAALTGTPRAPTAATATNTTQLATTAFVKAQLGTIASQDADAVAITGGTITGLSSALPVASGGTGLTAVGTDGQVLSSDGTDIVWGEGFTEADVKDALNANGSAPIYACRAWARLNGSTAVGAGNMSASVSGASCTVTFTTAMEDANYCVVVSPSINSTAVMGNSGCSYAVYNQTTTGFQIYGRGYTGSNNTSYAYGGGYTNMGIAVYR